MQTITNLSELNCYSKQKSQRGSRILEVSQDRISFWCSTNESSSHGRCKGQWGDKRRAVLSLTDECRDSILHFFRRIFFYHFSMPSNSSIVKLYRTFLRLPSAFLYPGFSPSLIPRKKNFQRNKLGQKKILFERFKW